MAEHKETPTPEELPDSTLRLLHIGLLVVLGLEIVLFGALTRWFT